MKLRTALFALTAASMAAAPLAAQARTTAADSAVRIAGPAGSIQRLSTPVQAKQKLEAETLILVVLAAGAATFGVVKALDDDKSSGT